MEKKEFSFYQDVKVTVWVRQHFTMEAESKEEALKLVEEYKTNDIGTSDDSIRIVDTEWMMDTWEPLTPEENGYASTVELYDAETKEMIGDNASHFFTGKEEETRELIGYQIMKGDEVAYGHYSFEVFRTKQDALDFIKERNLLGAEPVEIYKGDVEEPTFLGRQPRTFKKGERVFVEPEHEGYAAIVVSDTATIYEDDLVEVHALLDAEEDDSSGIETRKVAATLIYQLADDKVCPRCGNPLYTEHHDEIDYPYYCPDCQENLYNIEV